MGRKSKFPPEVRDRAVRLVRDQRTDHDSEWSAITSIASKIGCTPETLRKWVRNKEAASGKTPGALADQSEKISSLEAEVRELKKANEILRKASAFFAQAELDRRPR